MKAKRCESMAPGITSASGRRRGNRLSRPLRHEGSDRGKTNRDRAVRLRLLREQGRRCFEPTRTNQHNGARARGPRASPTRSRWACRDSPQRP